MVRKSLKNMKRYLPLCALLFLAFSACGEGQAESRLSWFGDGQLEKLCGRSGWSELKFQVSGIERRVIWKAPAGAWRNGAILVLHGGGGQADHFCAGGALVQPQIKFAEMALTHGFAVFALDSTKDNVTDAQGRACGKRFDFSVLNRLNLDLPYINAVISMGVPRLRPAGSSNSVFVTGLSTGGYMATRAAAELGNKITAFAPISAGDPFGTASICDTSLSKRTSAKGILVDNQTGLEIVKDNACGTSVDNEALWPSGVRRPPVKQFQSESDGIVDFSCFRQAMAMLEKNGFPVSQPFVIQHQDKKNPFHHLWNEAYNMPLLNFFESQNR